ncbi:MAG: type transport system permease protein [Actinomycetota bacterium]|nr:type transport system permease protein [Actinomycetota bacterium]
MARHFLRLKLTLLRNGLRSNWLRKLGIGFSVFAWFWLVVAALGLLLASRSQALVVPLVFDAFFLGWLLLPLLGMGTDETLDPSRLALLPLDRPALMRGLLTASLVGLGPIATLLALSGTLIRLRPGLAGTLVIGALVAVELLLCVAGSRATTTLFSGVLRSRRGRDVLVFVLAIAGLVPAIAGQIVPRLLVSPNHRTITVGPAGRALYWLPSGWLAHAVLQARAGHLVVALAELAAGGAAVAAALWLWAWALQRALTTSEPATAKKARKRPGLFSPPLSFLPRTRTGAVAAKEMRYMWRDPRRRASLLSVVILLAFPVAGIVMGRTQARQLVLLAGAGVLVLSLQAVNQFGLDGPAFWMNVAAGGDPAADLRGKNLAIAVPGAVVVAVEAVGLAALSGGWAYIPAALLLGAAAMGVTLGVANQASVLAPYPVTDSPTNLWGNNAGCLTALTGLLAMAVTGVLLGPVVAAVAVSLTAWRVGLVVVAAGAAIYGYLLWRLGSRLAANRLRTRQIEVLQAVSGRSAA